MPEKGATEGDGKGEDVEIYGEVERLKDQLTMANYNGLQTQLRAVQAESQLTVADINKMAPEAQAAQQRLQTPPPAPEKE